MLGGADQQVPIVFATLPPHWQVEARPAQLEPLVELWTLEHLLAHLSQKLDAVQGSGSTFLCNRLHVDVRVGGTYNRNKKKQGPIILEDEGYSEAAIS